MENLFHFLGEVEVVFRLWAFLFLIRVSVIIGTSATALFFWRELPTLNIKFEAESRQPTPLWITVVHAGIMFLTVAYHTKIAFFLPLFLLFLGFAEFTREHQSRLKMKESLLVRFFLGGFVTLGGLQGWWLRGSQRRVRRRGHQPAWAFLGCPARDSLVQVHLHDDNRLTQESSVSSS